MIFCKSTTISGLTLQIDLAQTFPGLRRIRIFRLLKFTFAIFSFIIFANYTGDLTSKMTVQPEPISLRSLKALSLSTDIDVRMDHQVQKLMIHASNLNS